MPGEIVVRLVSMKLCIDCSSSNKVEQTSDHLYKVYKLSMRAYWHKHVLRHAGTMLTSRDEVSLRPMCLPVVCRNVLVLLENETARTSLVKKNTRKHPDKINCTEGF